MKGHWTKYSEEELDWLGANRLLPIADYHAAFCARFARHDVTAANLHALRKRKGWKTGRTGQFSKGQVPLNKGKPCPPGKGGRHPNARKTQFKKGQLPHNTNYLGHERVSKDGYVEVSIDETNPHTGFERRYVLKHVHEWEKANGPIPEGHCLKCLDSNRLNTDPSNWALIPRALLPHLGGRFGMDYDGAEPEVKPVIMSVAKLKHAVKQVRTKAGAA
ncbi:HNH endonuclease [Sinorhizobium meliloti]|uniref:HNH endonuclease n=1 Tax=Rhizobium meliloti TaxID=382 RepID=UPI003F189E00